jgi:hypothetical protein
MVRRRPRWGLIVAVVALALIGWLNVRRSLNDVGWGRQLFLHEGRVQIVKIEDAATMVVRALDGPAEKYNGDFRVRLLGIQRPQDGTPEEKSNAAAALEITKRFVHNCPRQTATIVFDRQRFDETETPLAYLFCGEVFLNAELLRSRSLRLVRYPGMPGKWMRELIKISGEPLTKQLP